MTTPNLSAEAWEKGSVRWAEMKRLTCKNCQKRKTWGFCLRHCPRMKITRKVGRFLSEEEIEKLRQEAFEAGKEKAVNYLRINMPVLCDSYSTEKMLKGFEEARNLPN